MCKVCSYPSNSNHPNWLGCTTAWRDDAQALATENAELKRRIEAAQVALADCVNDLALHLYSSADYHADRAQRALEGR